jgi:hypothetical protein
MLNLRKGSTEQELAGFFATLEEQLVASATPTRAAFSKARKQLSEKVFAALNRGAIATFRAGWKTPLWHGFRLFAVDGTTLRLPGGAALEAFFGAQGSGPTLARASVLYDIGHDLVVDTQVSATCVSERELAVEHLAAARPGDLLLYDRGYQAFWLFALHLMRGVEFCMRLPRGSFSAADAFWEGTEPSAIITLNPSAQQRRDCRAQGAPDVPLRVRLVRVRLRGGETEILATSILKEARLPARLFAQLYHRRWSVEIDQPCCLRKAVSWKWKGVVTDRDVGGWPSRAVPCGGRAGVHTPARRPTPASGCARPGGPGGRAPSPCRSN